jgi:hypothetical protein
MLLKFVTALHISAYSSHHQVRWNSALIRSHMFNVSKWSQFSSSSYATCIVFFFFLWYACCLSSVQCGCSECGYERKFWTACQRQWLNHSPNYYHLWHTYNPFSNISGIHFWQYWYEVPIPFTFPFTTCFGANRPSSGILICQNCYTVSNVTHSLHM